VRARVNDATLLLVLLLALAPGMVRAQLWRGPAAIEVRVEDEKGHAVAGAQVRLRYLSVEPKDGPPPAVTDAQGRAAIDGLADGPWALEVSHEGHMTYKADLAVRADRKPDVTNSSQLKVGDSFATLRVKFVRARASRRPVETVPPPIPAPRPAPAQRPAVPSRPRAPSPAPVPEPPAAATPTPPPPPDQPARVPAQAPPPPAAPPAATSAPAPAAPAPAPAPVPAPPPPVLAPPPRPAPAAPPAVAPVPEPPPAAAAPSVRTRSFQDRTCFECKPDEVALSVEVVAPPGGVRCGDELAARLARGDEGDAGAAPGCKVLRVSLPPGAHYVGYRFEAQDGDAAEAQDCRAGQDCPVAGCRWPTDPVLRRGAAGTTVVAAFENRSLDRRRRATLTVYYTPAKR
jgi:carboxypeptidase family protein